MLCEDVSPHWCKILMGRSLRRAPFSVSDLLPISRAMSTPVEYLFAATLSIAEHAARKQGWHPHGRSGWIKPDGNEVHFICFAEQLAIVPKDATVYLVGDALPELARFKRKWTKLA